MQKLASSSVAAIRRDLKNRLKRTVEARQRLEQLHKETGIARRQLVQDYEELEAGSEFDELSQKEEEELAQLLVQLMGDEEPRLRELIVAAEQVMEETKIQKIMALLEGKFSSRSVLLFTEYKATQSLVMSALVKKFGEGCLTFINGDNRAERS